ncbi:uncharacterized protein LOC9643158 [Selaginella moellendorffii]|uniref:uncharacterized protein LOC9643158 n=1 Tax=Selaginella moellendorffii TaxID=88036 RepID=UPI000D1C8426|nr:uncharacterized protein LOC9643158 [Selaginella moellendorffii]|eukprot:XP_024516471.1 uncharacterized protein LOC9643158 [Selaginella moellendorffii]
MIVVTISPEEENQDAAASAESTSTGPRNSALQVRETHCWIHAALLKKEEDKLGEKEGGWETKVFNVHSARQASHCPHRGRVRDAGNKAKKLSTNLVRFDVLVFLGSGTCAWWLACSLGTH